MKPLCLVLNLDGCEDRLAHFADQAAQAGLAFERVAAVDGRIMSQSALAEAMDESAIFPLAPAEIGCMLSHRRAWRRILDSDAVWGVVFEDDACLSAQTGELIAALPSDRVAPTLIKLETYGARRVALDPKRIAFAGRTLQRLRGVSIGTAGYAINRSACQLLLDAQPRYALPPDLYLFSRRHGAFRKAAVFVMNPAPVIQADRTDQKQALFQSAFAQRGKQMRPRPPLLKLIKREAYRLLEQWSEMGAERTIVPWR